ERRRGAAPLSAPAGRERRAVDRHRIGLARRAGARAPRSVGPPGTRRLPPGTLLRAPEGRRGPGDRLLARRGSYRTAPARRASGARLPPSPRGTRNARPGCSPAVRPPPALPRAAGRRALRGATLLRRDAAPRRVGSTLLRPRAPPLRSRRGGGDR